MGIDLGSTNIKCVVFDEKGVVIATANRANSTEAMDSDHQDWVFWNPDTIWFKTKDCICECTAAIKGIGEVEAVAITGMGMDGVPVDKNGEWIYPFISWQCKRTVETSIRWSEQIGEKTVFDITGKQVMAIDTIYRIIWMRENKAELYSKIYKWLLIEDYINFKLCGAMVTDYSMASCTSLFDQKTKDWSDFILAAAGIDRDILPGIQQSGEKIGTVLVDVCAETGLTQNTAVILGGHDYSCAAVAAGAISEDKIFNIMGTWEMFFAATDQYLLSDDLYNKGFKFESHAAKGKYAVFTDVVSSLMIEWVKKQFFDKDASVNSWQQMIEMAQNSKNGSNGLFFLPHFHGKGCPHIDGKSLGAFIGLDAACEKGDIIRSVFEGLNYQFREMVDAYENMVGGEVKKIITVGGATKNAFWMQNKADISGKIIEVPGMDEATALGAALLAGIGVGIYTNEKEAGEAVFRTGKTYYPSIENERYSIYYEKFYKNIYNSLIELNHGIFDQIKSKTVRY